jgi:hypothetical protein
MTGGGRCVFIIGALLLASKLEGVPISGEVIYRQDQAENLLTLNGPNFSITGVPTMIFEEQGAYCFQGCAPDTVSQIADGVESFLHSTSGTIDGVFYPVLSWGSPAHPDEGTLFVGSGIRLPGTGSLTYTNPLMASGRLVFFEGFFGPCLICGLQFSATGRLFMTFEEIDVPEDPRPWLLTTEMRYTFTSIPEPSTFALMVTPLALYLVRRTVRARARTLVPTLVRHRLTWARSESKEDHELCCSEEVICTAE